MNRKRIILIAVSIMILFTSISTAYVPKEYQNKQFMTDYDVYMVSKNHMDKHWAKYNMDILISQYTNGWRCYTCLEETMQRKFDTEIKVKIEKVQKLPFITKNKKLI